MLGLISRSSESIVREANGILEANQQVEVSTLAHTGPELINQLTLAPDRGY